MSDGATLCYACADNVQRQQMASGKTYGAYVSSDGTAITTWSGGHLATVRQSRKIGSGFGYGGQLYVRAVDPSGAEWYGRNGGRGMCITLRRAVPR